MLLKMNNVGRLKPVEVRIDGLTVICGNNNTGKSTIGKTLYCIFNALYDIDENIRRDKLNLIVQYLSLQIQDRTYRSRKILFKSLEELLEYDNPSQKDIRTAVEKALRKDNISKMQVSLQEIADEIHRIILVNEEDVVTAFLRNILETEFEGHFGNVNHPRKKTTVDLEIKDKHISFHTRGTASSLKLEHYFSLEKQIIYLENPFALDYINDLNYPLYYGHAYGHSFQVGAKIRRGRLYRSQSTAVEEVLRNQKLEEIIKQIHQISDGEMVVEDGKILYQHANMKKSLGIGSLSTGVKTFLILKELLLNGDLEENGIMVIDEPEVHLHPEWQIKYAEVIVMLQKAYGLNIILTTHSMDFLSALVTYAKQYGIEGSCNYYLTQLMENEKEEMLPLAQLKWMNHDIQGMYASVSEPFEKLYQQMSMGD